MHTLMKQFSRKLRSKSGFTLVELIVVLVIMGILTAAVIPTVTGYVADAKEKVAASNAYMVEQAARLYVTDLEVNGDTSVPDEMTAEDLEAAGYLSDLGDTNYTITFSEVDGSAGRYTITVEPCEPSAEGATAP